MDRRTEIRLAGEGGQGMILAGIILAEAAAIYDGKQTTQTQSYGPEARGGASRSEVVISDGEIDHPEVLSCLPMWSWRLARKPTISSPGPSAPVVC